MNNNKVKTIGFSLSCGVTAGYDAQELAQASVSLAEFGEAYQKVALDVFENLGVYISGTAYETRTLYNGAWGCPSGGELTFTVTGVCNPQFTALEAYEEAVLAVAEGLRARFNQSTLTVEFREEEMVYLTKS